MKSEEMLYEQEIKIGDILKRVICRGKKILLISIIGAAVFVGYVVLSTMNQSPSLVMSASEIAEAEARIEELEDTKIANERAIGVCEDNIAELTRSVESNRIEIGYREDEIEQIRVSIEKTKGLEEIYQNMVDAMVVENIVNNDTAPEIMDIIVKASDAQDSIYEKESRIVTLSREIRNLEKMNEVTIPKEIENNQLRVMELDEDIEVIRKEIEELEDRMEETVTSQLSIIKVVVFGVFGFVLSLLVSVGYIAATMMFDGKIHNIRVFEDGYDLFVLGTISNERKVDVLNNQLGKIRAVEENVCIEEEKEVIATKIRSFSKTNKVMAIGTIDEERIRSVADLLKESINSTEIEFVSASNPMYSSESMNQMKNYELVLVEKLDETNMTEMSKLIRLLDKSEATVLGIIVV